MKKKILAAILLASLLLSGCSVTISPEGESTTAAPEPEQSTDVTTSGVSAVEGLPEGTTTTVEYNNEPATDTPDGFPVPYPVGTVEDDETLSQFKDIIKQCIVNESVLFGFQTKIPTGELLEEGYYLVDSEFATTISELEDTIAAPFASYYWKDTYSMSLDDLLTVDTTLGRERVKMIDDKLALYKVAVDDQIIIDTDTAVLTYLKGDYGTVVALGQLGEKYYWKTYDMINGYNGWVVEGESVEEASGEYALFSDLLVDKMATLSKIFGGAEPVYGDGSVQVLENINVEDDPYGNGFYYGLEVEKFMSIDEMKTFIRDMFTSEIAESYINLYVNRNFVESDGKLYMVRGAITPTLGTFDLSTYENVSIGTFDVVSNVTWEEDTVLPITIRYDNGMWKLDTRLPMLADTVVTQKSEFEG